MTPVLRYRNPGAAARWLCEAFGFHEQESAQESDQHVKYILLRLGDSGVLVRPVSNSVFDDLMLEPSAVGGGNTHVLYLPIADAEQHCARAKAAGAKIELAPQDDGLGGRFYTCRDPDGHLWSFGSKDYASGGRRPGVLARVPEAEARPPGQRRGVAEAPSGRRRTGKLLRRGVAALIVLALVPAGWFLYESYSQNGFEVGAAVATATAPGGEVISERLAAEASRRQAAEEAASDAAAKLSEEKGRRLAAEAALAETGSKLAEEEGRRLAAENLSAAVDAKLAAESARASEARQAADRLQEALARERREAKEALSALQQRFTEQTAETTRDQHGSALALSSSQELIAEYKANTERLQARLEAVEAEAARERAREAAAGIAASAEAAAAREQVTRLEQAQAKQTDELEAAYATLKAVRSEIESLRSAQQEAKHPPSEAGGGIATAAADPAAMPAPARATTPCAQAVQGKVRLGPQGSRNWPEASLARLCHGAESSAEPARCFDELMRGKISWGTSSTWTAGHALILCAGTRNARQTLDCFADSIAANETWATAISSCRLAKQ